MSTDTLFTKIFKHEIPADIRYQDDEIIVLQTLPQKQRFIYSLFPLSQFHL